MAALAAARMTLAPAARRLGMRPAGGGERRWWDVLLVVWMAWIFDAVNNLGPVRQHLAERDGAAVLDAGRSLHIAWAVWAAVAVWRLSPRAWLRGLAVAYPLVTMFAVMATGNHYLADGVIGAVITALAVLGADRLGATGLVRRRSRGPRC